MKKNITEVKKKTNDAFDANKTKSDDRNVDHLSHPSQENIPTHICVLDSQQMVGHEERPVRVLCLKTR